MASDRVATQDAESVPGSRRSDVTKVDAQNQSEQRRFRVWLDRERASNPDSQSCRYPSWGTRSCRTSEVPHRSPVVLVNANAVYSRHWPPSRSSLPGW